MRLLTALALCVLSATSLAAPPSRNDEINAGTAPTTSPYSPAGHDTSSSTVTCNYDRQHISVRQNRDGSLDIGSTGGEAHCSSGQ